MNVCPFSPVVLGPVCFYLHIAYSRYAKKCKKVGAFDLKAIVRANIASLEPYRCARDDYSEGILLDANENSLGSTSTKHVDLELNRYPDPLYYDIKEHVAKFRGVQKEQIFFGVGSDEAIDILFRIFCVPGIDNIVTCPPTYGMYKVCAKVNDVAVHEAPLTASFDLDVNGVLSTINAHTKMVFICSPGNPTAKRIPNSDVASVCEGFTSGLVVVDEAYIDFSNGESATALLRRYPNVVVLHTMSKAFGLAAIRLGSAIARDDIIQLMNNVKAPYNINKLSAQVALDVFKNGIPTLEKQVDALIQERHYLENKLSAVTVVKHVYASDANFVLFKVPQAKKIYQILADRGIVVRYRGTEMHCDDCIRVTVGTRKENDSFLNLFVKVAAELDLE